MWSGMCPSSFRPSLSTRRVPSSQRDVFRRLSGPSVEVVHSVDPGVPEFRGRRREGVSRVPVPFFVSEDDHPSTVRGPRIRPSAPLTTSVDIPEDSVSIPSRPRKSRDTLKGHPKTLPYPPPRFDRRTCDTCDGKKFGLSTPVSFTLKDQEDLMFTLVERETGEQGRNNRVSTPLPDAGSAQTDTRGSTVSVRSVLSVTVGKCVDGVKTVPKVVVLIILVRVRGSPFTSCTGERNHDTRSSGFSDESLIPSTPLYFRGFTVGSSVRSRVGGFLCIS